MVLVLCFEVVMVNVSVHRVIYSLPTDSITCCTASHLTRLSLSKSCCCSVDPAFSAQGTATQSRGSNYRKAVIGWGNCLSKRIGWGVRGRWGHTGSVHLTLYLCSAAPRGSCNAGQCSKHLHRKQRGKVLKGKNIEQKEQEYILHVVRLLFVWRWKLLPK